LGVKMKDKDRKGECDGDSEGVGVKKFLEKV
jgi:hypothetical protein